MLNYSILPQFTGVFCWQWDTLKTLATGRDLLCNVIVGQHCARRRVYVHVSDRADRRVRQRGDIRAKAPDCLVVGTYEDGLVGAQQVTDVFEQPAVGFAPGSMRVYADRHEDIHHAAFWQDGRLGQLDASIAHKAGVGVERWGIGLGQVVWFCLLHLFLQLFFPKPPIGERQIVFQSLARKSTRGY